ncbi:MAG: 3-hydroxyacyl-CoA dehydrogenase [Solirubrobacterales bacterium]|nr:3-hydroxyacyl-CoA dehydrogenase [Solirubrobacterales bacterium]
MTVERLGVAGAGTMGAGIAQLACLGELETRLTDPDPAALAAGGERVRADLDRGAERGRWSEGDAEAAKDRLAIVPELDDLAGCELVIEAAPERLELKRELFATLAAACGPEAVLASNTSSLFVTAIAAASKRPGRVVGMHFFNPPALMPLVEVVAGDQTAPATLDLATTVAERMRRTPVRAADGIGFLANRGARPFSLEALRLLGERVATVDQIDRIVRIGGGYRMGPFELIDLIGVDVNLGVARSFHEQSFGEPRWRPHPLQQRLVAAGRLGRKAGRGFYEYGDGPHRADDPEPVASPGHSPEEEGDGGGRRAGEGDGEGTPTLIEGAGFRAHSLERGSLAALAPNDALAVGFLALPDLATATAVEINAGPATAYDALGAAGRHFAALGKHVECLPGDAPGMVLGRIVCQLVNEACFAVGEGVGSREDLDTALRLGFNHPRGPFEWGRAIGPERVLAVLDALAAELGQERYRAAPLLRRWAATDQSGS